MIELTIGSNLYYIDKEKQIKSCVVFKVNKAHNQIGIIFPDLKGYKFVNSDILFTKLFPEYEMVTDLLNGNVAEPVPTHIFSGNKSIGDNRKIPTNEGKKLRTNVQKIYAQDNSDPLYDELGELLQEFGY